MPKQLINFAIHPDMLSQVDALSKKEDRSRSGIIRDALRLYLLSEKDRVQRFGKIKMISKSSKLSEKKAEELIEEIRSTLSMNQ